MADDRIIARKDGAIGFLVFNNPEKRNALSPGMREAAADVIRDFGSDDAVRVIVLTGAGDRSFVSGGDISRFEATRATPEAAARSNQVSTDFRNLLRGVGKPTVAMIRGWCLGGGMGVALSCDVRVCSEDAKFGIPAARLGIGYGVEGLIPLVALVGPSVAKDMLFTGNRYDAQQALRMGIVNYVVPANELEAWVISYAQTIAANAPLSVIAAKRIIDELGKEPDRRDPSVFSRVVADCIASQDYVEGRRAFMEKRKPVFTGK